MSEIYDVIDLIENKSIYEDSIVTVRAVMCVVSIGSYLRPIVERDGDVLGEIHKPTHIQRWVYHTFLLPVEMELDVIRFKEPLLKFFDPFQAPIKKILRCVLPVRWCQNIFKVFWKWRPVAVFLKDPRVIEMLWEADVDDRVFTNYPYRLPVLITGRVISSPYPDYAIAMDELKTIVCQKQHKKMDIVINIPPVTEPFDSFDWEAKRRSKIL